MRLSLMDKRVLANRSRPTATYPQLEAENRQLQMDNNMLKKPRPSSLMN
jgi:hypothetical protein